MTWFGSLYAFRNPFLAFLPAQLPLFLVGIGSYHFYAWFRASRQDRSTKFAVVTAALFAFGLLVAWHQVAMIIWAFVFGCVFVCGKDPLARGLGFVRAVLLHPWLQHLGKISYPLYLIHWPLIIVFLFVLLRWQPGLTATQAALTMLGVGMPLLLFAAHVLHRLIERPAMAFGKALLDRERSAKAANNALEPAA